MKKWMGIGAVVVAVIVVAGLAWVLSRSNSQDTGSLPAQSGRVEVKIEGMAFSPSALKIKKGTTVVWTNKDTVDHNVIADSDSEASGLPSSADLLDKDQTFSHAFTATGTFHYHCSPHPFMKGTIEVVE